jgi:hypothetical protein
MPQIGHVSKFIYNYCNCFALTPKMQSYKDLKIQIDTTYGVNMLALKGREADLINLAPVAGHKLSA